MAIQLRRPNRGLLIGDALRSCTVRQSPGWNLMFRRYRDRPIRSAIVATGTSVWGCLGSADHLRAMKSVLLRCHVDANLAASGAVSFAALTLANTPCHRQPGRSV